MSCCSILVASWQAASHVCRSVAPPFLSLSPLPPPPTIKNECLRLLFLSINFRQLPSVSPPAVLHSCRSRQTPKLDQKWKFGGTDIFYYSVALFPSL
mmetsp:Transcript_17042/g.30911  ORF Transcript_17042/g.30911 Transcript_17042/m.30911 type:complete len:97 (-) Transcript_17042:92-382(-)